MASLDVQAIRLAELLGYESALAAVNNDPDAEADLAMALVEKHNYEVKYCANEHCRKVFLYREPLPLHYLPHRNSIFHSVKCRDAQKQRDFYWRSKSGDRDFTPRIMRRAMERARPPKSKPRKR